MSRYFGDISCIEGFRHDISWRNIGPAIFQDLSREIGDLSQYIGDLAINRRFFSDIWRGQRGSTKVRPAIVPVNALQCMCYSSSTFVCCREDLNPKPKGLGFTRLPPELSCPLIHNMQQLYIYLNSYIKKI